MKISSSPSPVDILAIGIHPDDVELSCSGTLLSHIHKGFSVGLLDLTKGELGTRGNAELRTIEAYNAASLMGAKFRTQLSLRDGYFQNAEMEINAIIQAIRSAKPRLILANAPSDRHPDHGRASKLIADASFYSGLEKIRTTDEQGNVQDRWRPSLLLYYIQDYQLKADMVVDISDFMTRKIELIKCFESQFYNPASDELETPISGSDFIEFITSKSKVYGRPAGFEYAEGFIFQNYPGVKNIFQSFNI